MITEMHATKPFGVRVVGRKVIFEFNLDTPENLVLTDPGVVERSMAGYMLAYPAVEHYEATYLPGFLILEVTGEITQPHVDMYM